MSYQHKPLPKKQYSGTELIPLSCEKELLEIREDIDKGVNHKGKNFEICYQAIKEIYQKQGKNSPNANCANCTVAWNKILQNWFKLVDKDIRPKEARSRTEPKELKPVNNMTDEEEIAALKAECDAKGIKYHHKAGLKKLTELLSK